MSNIGMILNNFYEQNILTYIKMYQEYPIKLVSLVLDIAIVIFLAYELLRIVKDSRAWQLVKGIAFLIIATALSGLLKLHILNYILSTVMDWGVILIIIIFQPEIRRALEQLGGTNKFSRFFGFDKDIITKTKEDIYKVVIAVYELAKNKTGALIVMERDIQIKDIISTGIPMNAEVSPQLLVNIFVPNTPLHDGAVIIQGDKIACASAYFTPTTKELPSKYGARHRAAIGISELTDSITIVVSEETGMVSIAEGGKLIQMTEKKLRDYLDKIILNKEIKTESRKSGRTVSASLDELVSSINADLGLQKESQDDELENPNKHDMKLFQTASFKAIDSTEENKQDSLVEQVLKNTVMENSIDENIVVRTVPTTTNKITTIKTTVTTGTDILQSNEEGKEVTTDEVKREEN